MAEKTYKSCVIAGKTVTELPGGMDESHHSCVTLKLNIVNKIAELNAIGVTEFYCNCEYGVGLFAAEAVIALRESLDLSLNLIIPHERQAEKYSNEVRERYYNLHETADSVEILSTQQHECSYMAADMFMVHHSDVILTDSADSFIVRYAAENDKRIELIGEVLSPNMP